MSLKRFEDEEGNLYLDDETRDYIRMVGDVPCYPPYVRGICGIKRGNVTCQAEPDHVSYRPHMGWNNEERKFEEWVDEKTTVATDAATDQKTRP